MILVDKNIKKYSEKKLLIKEGYDVSHVNSISYDLTIGEFVGSTTKDYDIMPGSTVMIKTKEELALPNDITGRIGGKNSLIRLGLQVDGPQYQPGHTTFAFLRVLNLSDKIISLKVGDAIAQIYFEELKEVPEKTYDRQAEASFNNETTYRGYGKYDKRYKKRIQSIQEVKDDIEGMANKIYGNVLVLMGIIVAIFSLISINSKSFSEEKLTPSYIVAMNLSMTFCIMVMLGAILVLINGWKKRCFCLIYGLIMLLLAAATIAFCIFFI